MCPDHISRSYQLNLGSFFEWISFSYDSLSVVPQALLRWRKHSHFSPSDLPFPPTFQKVYWLKPISHPTGLQWSRPIHAALTLEMCFLTCPEGCPGLCNNNGRCTLEASGWHCICQSGWRGAGCHVAMETLCTDGKDNEGGMLTYRLKWMNGICVLDNYMGKLNRRTVAEGRTHLTS